MKSPLRAVFALTVALLGIPTVAHAQVVKPMRFTAPFSFEAGRQMMPAGTYLLTPVHNRFETFMLTNLAEPDRTVFVTGDGLANTRTKATDSDKIVFEPGQTHYVMCQVWSVESKSGLQLTGTYDLTDQSKRMERTITAESR